VSDEPTSSRKAGRPRIKALPSQAAADHLKAAMKAKRLSSPALAALLRVDLRKVQHWRNGKDDGPSKEEAKLLAEHFNDDRFLRLWRWEGDEALPDPAGIAALAAFKGRLADLRTSVGNPPEDWFRGQPGQLTREMLRDLLHGPRRPALDTVEVFLSACEAYARTEAGTWPEDPMALRRSDWQRLYRMLPATASPGAAVTVERQWIGIVPQPASRYQVRELAAALDVPGRRQHVLTGLGGVGKTQIAVRFARELWAAGRLDYLIWVQAGSRDRIINAYANAWAEITEVEDKDGERAAGRLLAWLETAEQRWLVVLDDLTDPADMRGLWPPDRPSGRTVITTRRTDSSMEDERRQFVGVTSFTEAEALGYVREKLTDHPGLASGAEQLVTALGCLPLALAQAIAYQLDRRWTCEAYLKRLDSRKLHTLAPVSLPDDQAMAVAAT
jgi:NB-ARC domain-containing protein